MKTISTEDLGYRFYYPEKISEKLLKTFELEIRRRLAENQN